LQNFTTTRLGRTGLQVGRLGLAASYGAPAPAFEAAFEKGCNYFYLGSGRHRAGMRLAIRNLCKQGKRDQLVIALHTYARFGTFTASSIRRRLKALGIEQADILILGWHNRPPARSLVDRALALKAQGMFNFIGLSGHNRPLFPKLASAGSFDLFHVRYNAAHRGAETEVFPYLKTEDRVGIVTYTATRWGHLLDPQKMPAGESVPSAADCYRFVMTNPQVDVCLCGPKDMEQMQTALKALDQGPLAPQELIRMQRIGNHVHRHSKSFFG
jgi:aryl-alcohol dehydrogenase-like predicted oxidoreductase